MHGGSGKFHNRDIPPNFNFFTFKYFLPLNSIWTIHGNLYLTTERMVSIMHVIFVLIICTKTTVHICTDNII